MTRLLCGALQLKALGVKPGHAKKLLKKGAELRKSHTADSVLAQGQQPDGEPPPIPPEFWQEFWNPANLKNPRPWLGGKDVDFSEAVSPK